MTSRILTVVSLFVVLATTTAKAIEPRFEDLFSDGVIGESSADEAEHCANFSGHWSGTCRMANGGEEQVSVKFDQYACRALTFLGGHTATTLPIGGLKHTSATVGAVAPSPASSSSISDEVYWNPEKTQLTAIRHSQVKQLFATGGSLFQLTKYTMQLKNGQLAVDIFDLTNNSAKIKFCRFNKN